jgi:RNA polymerase subunit RPABC4/transcription elongation factor Spt4
MKKINLDCGIIYVPWVISEHTKESLDEHNMIMNEYHNNHRACPVCGSTNFNTTLMAYILDINNISDYMDKNTCYCNNCGDNHITHDRIKLI